MEKNVYEIIQDWHELLKNGVITDDEFIAKKKELLENDKSPVVTIKNEPDVITESSDNNHYDYDQNFYEEESFISKYLLFFILGTICLLVFGFYYYSQHKEKQINIDTNSIQDSISKMNFEKKSTMATETLKDARFIDDYIINAIIDNYKKNYSKMETEKTEEGFNISFSDTSTNDVDYSGFLLSISISKMKKDYIFGDLDKDGIQDLIANIETSGGGSGGNVYWNDLFVFLSKDGKYVLTSTTESPLICGCASGYFSPVKIQDGLILGKSICWAEEDAHCCPSLNYLTTVEFDGKELKLKTMK